MALVEVVARHPIQFADGHEAGPGGQWNIDLAVPYNASLLADGMIAVIDPDLDPPVPVEPPSLESTVAVLREAPLNVRYPEYGAIGDGEENPEDEAGIQAAFDAAMAVAGGAAVLMPRGQYQVDSLALTYTAQNPVNVIGEGIRATWLNKKAGGGTGPILNINAAAVPDIYFTLGGFTIYGDNSGNHDAIRLTECARVKLSNLYATRARRGIDGQGSLIYELDRCSLHANQTGFYARKAGGHAANLILLDNCQITSNTVLGVDHGQGNHLTLRGCDIESNGATGNLATGGVRYTSVDPDSLVGIVHIDDCWFEGNLGRTLYASAGRVYVDGSLFLSPEGGHAVYAASGLTGLYMDHCDVYGEIEAANDASISGLISDSLVTTFTPSGSSISRVNQGDMLAGSYRVGANYAYELNNGGNIGGMSLSGHNLILKPSQTSAYIDMQAAQVYVKQLSLDPPRTAAGAGVQSVFIDVADNKLKWKDAGGTVKEIVLA